MNTASDRQSIAAFFRNRSDAENAIRDLKMAGFRSDQIGCSCDDLDNYDNDDDVSSSSSSSMSDRDDRRSFWQKVEGFFSGEEGYEHRDTGVGDGRMREGKVVGPTLTIPQRYHERLSSGGSIVTVHGDRAIEAEPILARNNGEIDTDFYSSPSDVSDRQFAGSDVARNRTMTSDRDLDMDRDRDLDRGDVTGERRIQLLSERLRVNKERVQRGEVRVRKEVRTETQHVEVPVTHEELVIERVPVDNERAVSGQIGTDDEIRVPLSEERVNVEKSPVVREEVRVGKRAVQNTEQVSDEVRHEELKVDDDSKLTDVDRDRKGRRKIA